MPEISKLIESIDKSFESNKIFFNNSDSRFLTIDEYNEKINSLKNDSYHVYDIKNFMNREYFMPTEYTWTKSLSKFSSACIHLCDIKNWVGLQGWSEWIESIDLFRNYLITSLASRDSKQAPHERTALYNFATAILAPWTVLTFLSAIAIILGKLGIRLIGLGLFAAMTAVLSVFVLVPENTRRIWLSSLQILLGFDNKTSVDEKTEKEIEKKVKECEANNTLFMKTWNSLCWLGSMGYSITKSALPLIGYVGMAVAAYHCFAPTRWQKAFSPSMLAKVGIPALLSLKGGSAIVKKLAPYLR
jgi:hypothetical protein